MVRFRMVSAYLQAMQERFKANRMTVLTKLNTFPHFARDFRPAPRLLHNVLLLLDQEDARCVTVIQLGTMNQ